MALMRPGIAAPPPMFSITTAWPHSLASASPTMRAAMSVAWPAGYGTMSFTGRLGYCAWATAPNASSAAAKNNPAMRWNMSLSSLCHNLGVLRVLHAGAHHVFTRAAGGAMAGDADAESPGDLLRCFD